MTCHSKLHPLLRWQTRRRSDSKGKASFLERVNAWKQLNIHRLRERDGENLRLELQSIAIGDRYAMVSMPHKVFVELGMQIREASPFPVTAVVTLAQDIDFYVPTRKVFEEGSYEVTTSSFQPGGEELIVEAAVELLRDVAGQSLDSPSRSGCPS